MKPVQPVKFVAMMSVGRVVEAMKPARLLISAKMKSVASAVAKMTVAPTARFALRRAVRRVVETTKTVD